MEDGSSNLDFDADWQFEIVGTNPNAKVINALPCTTTEEAAPVNLQSFVRDETFSILETLSSQAQ